MEKRLDIVCHAFPSWRGDYLKSTVQLMKELAVNHNVLYIDYAYSIKDILLNTKSNKYIPVKRILGINNMLEEIVLENGSTLNVLSLPPIIPFNWINNIALFNVVQRANSKIVSNRIKQALKKLNMSNPILVNAFNPFFNSVKSRAFNQKASIYYCYDNITAATWASKHGTRLEKELITQIDAVVFSSEALQKSKKIEGASTYVVNNGVDLSLFENEIQNVSFKSDKNEINIGYVGTIDDRLDFDLLEKMVKYFDSWNFHLIGRITTSKSEFLKQYSNVKLYGAVDVKSLPSILKNMNAGIIPFVKNEFTKNIYPMKANEYLALGMPVVMTDFAKLNDLNNIVTVSKKDSFILKLLSEIENDTLEKQQQRIQKAKANSWKNKAIEFENILLNYA